MNIPWRVVTTTLVMLIPCAATAAPSLTGQWGGDHALLTMDATSGRIEYDCGAGRIDAPVVLSTNGQFSADGRHEDYSPGPTPAASAEAPRRASYIGKIDGNLMTLTVRVDGDKVPRSFKLVRGQHVKLARCL